MTCCVHPCKVAKLNQTLSLFDPQVQIMYTDNAVGVPFVAGAELLIYSAHSILHGS